MLEENKKYYRKNLKFNMVFSALVLIVFLGVSLYRSMNSGGMLTFQFSEEGMTVTSPDKDSFTVEYGDISSIELEEAFDPGTSAGGEETENYRFGLFESEKYGKYQAALYKEVSPAVILTTGEGIYAVNFESEKVTEEIFEEISTKVLTNEEK